MGNKKLSLVERTGFAEDQVYCIMDYETYSEAELKKMGAYEYARDPSTEIICVAWRVGTRAELKKQLDDGVPAKGWIPDLKAPQKSFSELFQTLMHPHIILVAHNAFFEQVVTRYVFAERHMYSVEELREIPHSRWICTATLAATLAVPRSLENSAKYLGLTTQKDMEGAKLLKKMMRPAKPTTKETNPRRHRDNPENIKRLLEYCKTDVDAETALFLKAPPLMKSERELWLLDQEINCRGFKVDRPLIKRIKKLINLETKNLDNEAWEISESSICPVSSARERDAVLTFLDGEGEFLPDLKKKTVDDRLLSDEPLSPPARRMLELRQAVSKSSTAKYPVMLSSSMTDGRVRDTLLFVAASTGRWGGSRVNPQNFKRPHLDTQSILALINHINRRPGSIDASAGQELLEFLRLADGNPMDVFGSMLRSMIIPGKGKVLHVADFNAIEVRVLFWLADHQKGLKAFRDGELMYEKLAAKIYGCSVEEIGPDSVERFVGKTANLGCGYGMGGPKFQMTCKDQGGVEISRALADKAVQTFRFEHKPVVNFWYALERAAIAAVKDKAKEFEIGKVSWFCWRDFLCCRLPSGRLLYYLKPHITYDPTPWGDTKETLRYYGIDKSKKKMVVEKTYGGKLAENVCQASSRDVMANSMIQLKGSGHWDIVLTVHDEALSETSVMGKSIDDYVSVMSRTPSWGEDIPLLVKGYEAMRYRK